MKAVPADAAVAAATKAAINNRTAGAGAVYNAVLKAEMHAESSDDVQRSGVNKTARAIRSFQSSRTLITENPREQRVFEVAIRINGC